MAALLAVVPTGLLLATLELGGRRAGFRPETWSVLDDELGYTMRVPTQSFPVQRADLIVLGDSLSYPGYPVAGTEESFVDRLRDSGLSTVNLSGIGYGTDQELLLLKRHLAELPAVPHLVVNFCLFNDLIDNGNEVNPHDGFRPKPYFELENGRPVYRGDHLDFSALDRFSLYVRQRSGAVYLLRRVLGLERLPEPDRQTPGPSSERRFRVWHTGRAPDQATYVRHLAQSRKGIPVTEALLGELGRIAAEQLASELALFLHPSGHQPAGESPWQLDPAVRAMVVRLNREAAGDGRVFTAYDMGCHYRQEELPYATISFDRVGHLTRRGHAEVARAIGGWVRGEPIHPECDVPLPGETPAELTQR